MRSPTPSPQAEALDDRADPFGLYRAEWLSDALFKLFTKPAYYPELETLRPCVLVGGRGTGKTTVLRCLSYDGRYVLEGSDNARVEGWRYYGVYYRVNTNRVTAFRGDELSDQQWVRSFAHYINLLLCGQIVDLAVWYKSILPQSATLSESDCFDISEGLFITEAHSIEELQTAIGKGRRRFEGFLNNISPEGLPSLSLQGQPIDDLCAALMRLPQFKGKQFFFIIDEFESLLDYQQEVLNTLIKHSGQNYTFKVGVRELGWRKRSTLNSNEQLISPADYERIDIAQRLEGDNFIRFASDVCNMRAQATKRLPEDFDIEKSFPGLTPEAESVLLGVGEPVAQIRKTLSDKAELALYIADMTDLELFFADFWARSKGIEVEDVLHEALRFPVAWRERYSNYKVATLFSIRAGRVGLRKFYCGWRTYTKLADGNIRYLLELVGQARALQRLSNDDDTTAISPELQSRAAQLVGRKNLAELEGLSVHGAQLTKLLLGLGRIFEILASDPEGHAPEVTQFHIPDNAPLGNAEGLLTSAVMHLALVRSVSNKRMDFDLKAYDYAVHPIFSAFFNFSHRKKRKITLTPRQLLALVEEPKNAIRQLLKQNNRVGEYPLSEQLQLFEGFYGKSS